MNDGGLAGGLSGLASAAHVSTGRFLGPTTLAGAVFSWHGRKTGTRQIGPVLDALGFPGVLRVPQRFPSACLSHGWRLRGAHPRWPGYADGRGRHAPATPTAQGLGMSGKRGEDPHHRPSPTVFRLFPTGTASVWETPAESLRKQSGNNAEEHHRADRP